MNKPNKGRPAARRLNRAMGGTCRVLAVASVTAAAVAMGAAQAQSLPVTTTSGVVQGNTADANGVTSFRGIPFAAPPVGPLRWRAPAPVVPASGTRGAFSYGPACIAALAPNPNTQSEDCLTVNVWTPDLNPATPKAVMVWIYGGGFQFGASSDPRYDGSHLAAHDVVVVSLNYRVGVLGFLADAQLDAEAGTSGNYGLMDQIAALQWVRQNIAAFGGDPNRVTIFGESAGAHAVGMLLASPQTKGLINGAILESGAFWDLGVTGSIATHAEADALGAGFVAKFPPGQDLRALDAFTVNAADPYPGTTSAFPISPNLDGKVLNVSPAEAFIRGQTPNVPLLAGWNAAEYFLFQPFALPHATAAAFDAAAANLFATRCLPQFSALYPAATDPQATPSAFQLDGDTTIAEQTWEALADTRRAGAAPAYAYNFTYTSPYSPIASHTAELPFVFGTAASTKVSFNPGGPPASAADLQFSGILQSYWTNFAKTGNPNGPGLPAWPVFTGVGSQVIELNAAPFARANTDEARFQFLASYRSHGRLPAAWRTVGAPGATYPGLGCGTATFKP